MTKPCDCCDTRFNLDKPDWVKLDYSGDRRYILCPDCGRALERLLFGRTDD